MMVRFKNRYLLCVLETEHGDDAEMQRLTSRALLTALRASVVENFGDVGAGHTATSLAIKLWSPALRIAIVRAARDHFRTVWAAASFITELPTISTAGQVRFRVIHVGGTIRACQGPGAKHARELILEQRKRGVDAKALVAAAASAERELNAMAT